MRRSPSIPAPRTLLAVLLVTLTVVATVLGPLPTGAVSATVAQAAPAAPAAPAQRGGLTARLAELAPTVAQPNRPVTATVAVRNTSGRTLTGVRAGVRIGEASRVRGRPQVQSWAAGQGSASDPLVASTPVRGPLPAGAEIPVAVTLPPDLASRAGAYGALPLTVEATAGEIRGSTASFLPFQVRKEYEPLSMAFAAPLTLDPDPQLVTATGNDLLAAWRRLLAPEGRLSRLVEATEGRAVTWAIDPVLVGATPTSDDAAAPDEIARLRQAFATRLAGASASRDLWALPPQDPDLPVVVRGSDAGSLRSLLGSGPSVAGPLGRAGVARVAWPVGPLAPGDLEALTAAYGGTGPAATILPSSSIASGDAATPTSARHTPGGRPLLVADDELGRLFSGAGVATPAENTQRFLAETVALLGEAPGRPRSVLVAADRDADVDPGAVATLFGAIEQAPWIRTTTTSDLVAAASDPSSPVQQNVGGGIGGGEPGPLTPDAVARIEEDEDEIAGLAQVLAATRGSLLVPDASTTRALLSARWRGNHEPWERAKETVGARLDTLTSGVTVVPSTVNFFADHGALQVTVVNHLDVEVHDVRLVVEPEGRPPRLRVTRDPGPLRISPKSRTTVRLDVEAIAAGVVPVSTHLATPTGTRLGTDATVRVRVQPANGWVMLALGGLVGLVFLAGLYRALRAGSPRVSSEDLKEIDLE